MGQGIRSTIGNPCGAELRRQQCVSDDPTERNGEGGDLSTEDRRSIDGHLQACPSCRQHRTALDQALGALATVAASLPVPPDDRSLWPMLERRIETHKARTSSRWFRAVHGIVDRGLRAWAVLDGERPLRLAWMRDNLREAIAGQGVFGDRSRRRPGLVLGLSVAAAVLALLIGFPAASRQSADAESTIRATTPLAGRVDPPVNPRRSRWRFRTPATTATSREPVGSGRADPRRPTPCFRTRGTPASKAGPPRFGYDLEHGIHAASTRSKLVY
jgi:hypothetical protein